MAQGNAGHKVVQTSVKPAEVVVNKDRIEHPFKGSMDGQRVDGYRGIWFTIGQARSDYGDKYSGGLGTYTMKHIPMAVYSKEADKTFFVYGGAPDARENYLLCMIGCYDHKSGMLSKPVVVHDKGATVSAILTTTLPSRSTRTATSGFSLPEGPTSALASATAA